ncbi:MAG: hypothetical protein KAI24_23510 [Planctomycetes bacterium]|nr:hypothetical protein [Planctomycetota bacterium]
MPSTCLSWAASVALTVGSSLLPAQQTNAPQPGGKGGRLERLVARSVAELRYHERRLDAVRRLENLGKLALPAMLERLHWQRRGDLSRQQQADLLYVIGKLGRDGLPALPAIREWVREGDREAAQQLAYTLIELAPFFDGDQAAAVRDDWQRSMRTVAVYDADVLLRQLDLHGTPSEGQLRSHLQPNYYGDASAIAICRWLTAHADSLGELRQPAIEQLRARLERDLRRQRVAFSRAPTRAEPFVAATWRRLTAAPLDAAVARALLTHADEHERHRATLWLSEHGAALPMLQRADLPGRLWDSAPRVARGAAEALGRWGRNGLVGLPALAWMLDRHDDQGVRDACRKAIADVRDAMQSLPEPDRAWLVAAIDVLCDRNGWPPQAPPGAKGRAAIHELLLLAQWSHANRVARLLDLLDRSRPNADAVGAIYGWLRHHDHQIVDEALSFLARHPAHVTDAIEARGASDGANELARLTGYWVDAASRGTAFEMNAWVVTHGSSAAELVELLDHGDSRLVARALAALLVRQPAKLRDVQPRLRVLSDLDMRLQWRVSPQDFWQVTDFRLSEPLRVLASLALARHGAAPDDRHGLDDLVRQHCGVALAELPGFVAAAEDRQLRAVVDALEAECRRRLYVPEHLKWPTTAAR